MSSDEKKLPGEEDPDELDELDDLSIKRWEAMQDEDEEEEKPPVSDQEQEPPKDEEEEEEEFLDEEESLDEDDDFEDKISIAMEKIIQDAMKDSMDSEEDRGPQQQEEPQGREPRRDNRNARPGRYPNVPVEPREMELPPQQKKKKKFKGLKTAGIVAAMFAVIVGTGYAAVSYYYADKFFEGTTINGIDCSGMTAYEVEQAIARQVETYSIQVDSRNLESQTIDGSRINYQYLSSGDVLDLLKHQKPYQWILGYVQPVSYTVSENITFDKNLLQSEILALDCAQPENQVEPENAYVAFQDSKFQIVPETKGSTLNLRNAYQLLNNAISEKQRDMDFTSTPKAYVKAEITSEDPMLQATVEACNNYTNASISYVFGDETVTLDGNTIKDWLQFDEKGQFVRDETSFQQHVSDFVDQLASTYDTVGTSREFYTTSGRTVYVYGSAYGWKIDRDGEKAQLLQEIQSGTQVTREPVYSMRANARGRNDLGNTYIEVDLSNQYMYYYQNGGVIFESDIVSGLMGDPERETPPGIFTLYSKSSPDTLRGGLKPDGTYEYETEVTYWMPFNGGVGFHDANWQPYFGGDRYLYGGSHGCINLPPYKAAELYSIIQYGVPIVVFY